MMFVAGSRWIIAGLLDEIVLPLAEYDSRKYAPRSSSRTAVPFESKNVVMKKVPSLW